jgi:hypothetical protein
MLIVLLGGFLTTWADNGSEAWPEPSYFPQRVEQTESSALQQGKPAPVTDGQFGEGAPTITPAGKKKLHFRKKNNKKNRKEEKEKEPFHAVPPKPSAQKADPPASPYPLLRLPMPIITNQGIVQPGIYLIKTEIDDPKIGSMTFVQEKPKAELDENKPLLLTRQNQVMARIPIHPATLPDENMAQTGTTSPLSPTNPKIPPPIKIRVEFSADQRSLHLVVTNGNQHYESDEYAIGTDLRRKLTY